MDRLNLFSRFESKKEHHEDALTRALLVVLRLVPEAHAQFLDCTSRRRDISLPSLPQVKDGAIFRTQIGSIACEAQRLLSVLLTDAPAPNPIPVKASSRGAVYDGLIGYPPEWVFVIENKPHHEHVWPEQLCPSIDEGCQTEIEPHAVVIPWQDLLHEFRQLLLSGQLHFTAAEILRDFLDYVHESFCFLNPYCDIAICGKNLDLLNKRCQAVMQEIAPGRVEYHKGWKHYIRCDNAPAQQIALDAGDQSGQIVLSLYPGDSIRQARQLYANVNVQQLLVLTEKGWAIRPNLHFAHIQRNLYWATTAMPIADYVAFWQRQQRTGEIRQVEVVDARLFGELVAGWQALDLLDEGDKKKIHELFITGNRKKVNVCPGLGLSYKWDWDTAKELDSRGTFVETVKMKIREASETWKQQL